MQCTFDNPHRQQIEQIHLKNAESNAQICLKKDNYDALEKFLTNNVTEEMFHQSQLLEYSRIKLCWHKGDFDWCKYHLQKRFFAEPFHRELQLIWNDCLYKDFEKQTGRIPCHTERWRIRARQRLPFTIWDGLPIKYSYRVQDIEVLEQQFRMSRYPTIQTKKYLVSVTHLSSIEVEKWFRNRRGRDGRKRKKERKEIMNESKFNEAQLAVSYSAIDRLLNEASIERRKSLENLFFDNFTNHATIIPTLDFD